MADLVGLLVRFARTLRAEGVAIGPGDVLTYCASVATLDPTDLVDLYWGGRIALVTRHEDVETYDRIFEEFFLGTGVDAGSLLELLLRAEPEAETTLETVAPDPGDDERPDEETTLGLMASDVETLSSRAFAECTDDELETLRRIMSGIRLRPPMRRTRRTRPARRGRRPDLRATVRRSLRTHGELVELRYRRRRVRPRPLVLILDISGSMADYSRAMLQFAHSAQRGARFRVEVFCFGTRLTHLTPSLRTRSPDEALARAADLVVDWEGGTRIGQAIDEFVRRWGRRGMARGGIVVVCSDGLDRGDPELLESAMQKLARLCHRVVWTNPHVVAGGRGVPRTVGMLVAEPYVDVLLSGRDLGSLDELAALLPELG
ncbi:VWA domain-containing protein [Pseudonocardia benzenivorans]|uniref:VWA containing CoxE family protein n=2 Tax=Pseudonocardia TaxID=1847 RepID=F4D012_PSEUX|nr:VWA domain-containing protein [Pseudonocardia dioxanivorans]AEA24845.1 VWA containing CoxE family protein [Pseudonocardia dioxanivorans CB1190]GJF02710.1 hypothetical protein PSD17_16720 [Pseudonocardia sp. D17]